MERIAIGLAGALVVLAPTAALAAGPGLLDRTFGTDGTAQVRVAGQHGVQCCFVTVDGSGRVLLTGNDVSDGSSRVFVRRLLPSGAPDASYGSGGRVQLAEVPGAASLVLTPPRLLPGGGLQVLTQARASFASPSRVVLTRLGPAGTPDPAFGVGGRSVSAARYAAGSVLPFGVASDGTTTVAAAEEDGTWSRVRYDPDGTVQPGRPRLDLGRQAQVVWGVAVDGRGRTTMVGDTSTGECGGTVSAALRLLDDGRLDPAFGTAGRTTLTHGQASFASVTALAGGGYLLGDGSTVAGSSLRPLLARLDDAGRLVPAFGRGGYVEVGRDAVGFGTVVRDGAITQAVWDPFGSSAVFRLDLASGSLVRSFGRHGRIPLSLSAASMDSSGSVAVDARGRVVVAAGSGQSEDGYALRGLVRRWLPSAADGAEPPAAPSAPASDGLHSARARSLAC